MWLMHYITNNSLGAPPAEKGELSRSSTQTAVASSGEHKNLEFCFPYGLASVPPNGERGVVLPLDDWMKDSRFGLGCGLCICCSLRLHNDQFLRFFKGGASLVLKNDGRVLINGREVGND